MASFDDPAIRLSDNGYEPGFGLDCWRCRDPRFPTCPLSLHEWRGDPVALGEVVRLVEAHEHAGEPREGWPG